MAAHADNISLPIFEQPRTGCITHMITNDEAMPHIRPGEFVIVDPSQKDVEVGHLHLIQWNNGNRSIVEVTEGFGVPGCFGVAKLRTQACVAFNGDILHPPIRFVDGPYPVDYLQEKLVGRVIGLLAPAEPVFGILE